MENSINLTISPLQMLLTLAFQIWMVVFPIILIRKINYLIALFHERFSSNSESSPNP